MGKVDYADVYGGNQQVIEYDDEYSFKSFTNVCFLDDPKFNFNNRVIYRTDFSQEIPESHIFNEQTKGVTFVCCNLSNVFIPQGNTILDCIQIRSKIQNDLNTWIVDDNNNPIKPLDYEIYIKFGLEIPKVNDIPIQKVSKRIDIMQISKDKKAGLI